MIHLIHILSKPSFLRIASKKPHSTLSYALFISIFKAISYFLPFFFNFRWWKTSYATMILSCICLPTTNALWFSVISSPNKGFILFTITFVIILFMKLHKLIGLKCETILRPFYLRIKTTSMLLISLLITFFSKKITTTATTWFLMIP